MGHMPGGDMLTGGLAMGLLVVEEYVGLIGPEELGFVQPPQENRLVDTDIPGPQCADDPLVGRG